jgi:nicotinamide-nucleotide amidase
MNAELIAVGSELLRFGKTDGNSEWLTGQLQRCGIEVVARTAVDDDVARIVATVSTALRRADVVLLTGGLGPTQDDRTRDALSRALDAPLELDEERARQMRELYARHGRTMGPAEASQALRLRGSSWLENRLGSAAGVLVQRDGRVLAAMPGVPAEMRAMFTASVLPLLTKAGSGPLQGLTLKIAGQTESSVDRLLGDLYRTTGLEVTVLGGLEGLELHVRARSEPGEQAESAARLQEFERQTRQRLGPDVFGVGDDRLAGVVGDLLRRLGRTLATAESCTAGLLGAAITSVPGSSKWYRGGWIVYDDRLKWDLAGIRAETLAEHGAVSETVARQLAEGARTRCGADMALAVIGIAGPDGGTEDKPVGLVHLALQDGGESLHRRLRLIGDRQTVRRRAVAAALDLLRRRLLGAA